MIELFNNVFMSNSDDKLKLRNDFAECDSNLKFLRQKENIWAVRTILTNTYDKILIFNVSTNFNSYVMVKPNIWCIEALRNFICAFMLM